MPQKFALELTDAQADSLERYLKSQVVHRFDEDLNLNVPTRRFATIGDWIEDTFQRALFDPIRSFPSAEEAALQSQIDTLAAELEARRKPEVKKS